MSGKEREKRKKSKGSGEGRQRERESAEARRERQCGEVSQEGGENLLSAVGVLVAVGALVRWPA